MSQTILILFRHNNKSYRMRVAKVHEHPGERDRIEVSSKDMLGAESWSALPDSSPHNTAFSMLPSSEWLIRRALWHTLDGSFHEVVDGLATVYLGEI